MNTRLAIEKDVFRVDLREIVDDDIFVIVQLWLEPKHLQRPAFGTSNKARHRYFSMHDHVTESVIQQLLDRYLPILKRQVLVFDLAGIAKCRQQQVLIDCSRKCPGGTRAIMPSAIGRS